MVFVIFKQIEYDIIAKPFYTNCELIVKPNDLKIYRKHKIFKQSQWILPDARPGFVQWFQICHYKSVLVIKFKTNKKKINQLQSE